MVTITQLPTTAVLFKKGLRDQLQLRPGLADVQVYYGDSIDRIKQSIRIAQVSGASSAPKAIAPARRARDETYTVHVLIDVVDYAQSSEECEVRALEIFQEVTDMLQDAPQLIPQVLFATLSDWEMQSGYTQESTYGAGIDLQIDVKARLT